MAQVAVGKGIRRRLEPDDEGVRLGHGADEGVVDPKVDDKGGEDEGERDVDHVRPGDDDPDVVKLAAVALRRPGRAVDHALARPDGLSRGGQLDEVGDEEVAGDEAEEAESQEDVMAAKVVAFEADEDAVLGKLAIGPWRMLCLLVLCAARYLLNVFNH